MRKLLNFLPLMVASAALVFVASQVAAKNVAVAPAAPAAPSREEAKPADSEPAGPAVAFKVYEWGVETQHWAGGSDARFGGDVPAAYYDASEVPIAAEPAPEPEPKPKPQPKPDPNGGGPRKPVLYFECKNNVTFDLNITFASGKVTWMYPKPSRRTSEATAQWSGIRLHSDFVEELRTAPAPKLLDVPKDHWANFSREASNSNVEIGGERERFLFYEGATAPRAELDVSRNARGEYILRNYTAYPIHDFGSMLKVDDRTYLYVVPEIPAATGEAPGEVIVTNRFIVEPAKQKELLAAQCEAAGLTAAHAKVFNRCWYDEFFATMDDRLNHDYWYRRDPRALDESVELKLKLPAGFSPEFKRVGYVFVHGVDYDKLAEFDKLVADALGGNADAADKLKKGGIAAAGAVRRAMLEADQPLKKRLELAKLLKSIGSQ